MDEVTLSCVGPSRFLSTRRTRVWRGLPHRGTLERRQPSSRTSGTGWSEYGAMDRGQRETGALLNEDEVLVEHLRIAASPEPAASAICEWRPTRPTSTPTFVTVTASGAEAANVAPLPDQGAPRRRHRPTVARRMTTDSGKRRSRRYVTAPHHRGGRNALSAETGAAPRPGRLRCHV